MINFSVTHPIWVAGNIYQRVIILSMPLNSFFLFCKDNRKEVKKENSNLSNSEVTAILGEQWRNAGVSVKEKYQDLAKKNREVN